MILSLTNGLKPLKSAISQKQHLAKLLYLENPALDVGFQNAYSYGGNKKTPSDIIKDAVWQLHFNIRRRTFR